MVYFGVCFIRLLALLTSYLALDKNKFSKLYFESSQEFAHGNWESVFGDNCIVFMLGCFYLICRDGDSGGL